MERLQVLPFRVSVNLRVMIMKRYSTFPKLEASPSDAVQCGTKDTKYFSAALADRAGTLF